MSDDALNAARLLAAGLDPLAAAVRCGAEFVTEGDAGCFRVPFLGADVAIRFPGFEFDSHTQLPSHVKALLVYYLATSDGSIPNGPWCSFADLPNARFYSRAFQGYTGDALSRRLGDRADGLAQAVALLGGRTLPSEALTTNADRVWVIPGLPRVPVALLWWDSDDEFPSRAELLFDITASNHLPTDGCAVLGSWLTTRLTATVDASRS